VLTSLCPLEQCLVFLGLSARVETELVLGTVTWIGAGLEVWERKYMENFCHVCESKKQWFLKRFVF
jgi:intein-encoded DNA endonuclease-like protein